MRKSLASAWHSASRRTVPLACLTGLSLVAGARAHARRAVEESARPPEVHARPLLGTHDRWPVASHAAPTSCSATAPGDATPPTHDFVVERTVLTMPDGVPLATTLFRPLPRRAGERFPALLELLPYRKDDSFYRRDYPLHSYFACRGFVSARVDVRGTGGSGGRLPLREYSDDELTDATEVIAQLAARDDVNGAVGMWGISWGGFNAIQTAMRAPPALRAILALHSSDDLYGDDVRYFDGALHLDPYALQIDHENGLPRTPDYPLDSAYFADRFDQRPWLLTYLAQPVDGPFWRDGSLRFHPERLRVPAYLIGGLADGYRDTPLRVLSAARAPVKVEIGPWAHDWPDNGTPGPNYEWRSRAVRWWRHWLAGDDTGLLREPNVLLFVRDAVAPGPHEQLAGAFRFVSWPPVADRATILYARSGRRLERAPGSESVVDSLPHVAGLGSAVGVWWGDAPGDLADDDRRALTYDTAPLAEGLQLVGFPTVHLRARSAMERVAWSVRLEDVFPDGRVALVAGRVLNGALTADRIARAPDDTPRVVDTTLTLHFTTWTFPPGHRLRISVSHAQFPMAWPTPYRGRSLVYAGVGGMTLTLPSATPLPVPVSLPEPVARDPRPDASMLEQLDSPPTFHRDPRTGAVRYSLANASSQRLGATRIDYQEQVRYDANERDPARAGWDATASHDIRIGTRRVQLHTSMRVRSSIDSLYVQVQRRVSQNGRVVRQRTWREVLPRGPH
ncbi:MAG: CocE/NonD family hydrolase [Gemmatimonadaceae bacterium]|nr:CocE/NonD family hydrolase [Gemmatimonadaceae bacterium]